MLAASKGNQIAMALVFERNHLRIFNFFFQMLKDRAVSEDLTQEVFLKVLKYKESYANGNFISWIYKISRNILKDHYKVQVKDRLNKPIEEVYDDLETEPIEKEEEIKHLMHIIDRLDPKDRELIVMNRLQGVKYDQIAEITGNSALAIRIKVHRILKKMRKIYFETINHEL